MGLGKDLGDVDASKTEGQEGDSKMERYDKRLTEIGWNDKNLKMC